MGDWDWEWFVGGVGGSCAVDLGPCAIDSSLPFKWVGYSAAGRRRRRRRASMFITEIPLCGLQQFN